jgi:Lrp/AsnC family transcriptional regulator
MVAYDPTDLRILDIVQSDASLPIAEIADRVHLSQNACWRRIKLLEEQGIIAKRVALLDPVKLGVGTTVFVTVKAGEHTEKWLENFSAAVRKIPEVVEFYRLTGEIDYLLKLQVADIADYDRIYKQLIRSAKLTDVSSAFAMEELKKTTAIPMPRR